MGKTISQAVESVGMFKNTPRQIRVGMFCLAQLKSIGVLFGCFGGTIDGPGLRGLIIYQGHLFALKGHLFLRAPPEKSAEAISLSAWESIFDCSHSGCEFRR